MVTIDEAANAIPNAELFVAGGGGLTPRSLAGPKARTAPKADVAAARPPMLGQYAWLVGRNRISLISTSSGWLMANATALAKESAGIAIS
jgi:hypothetical protein